MMIRSFIEDYLSEEGDETLNLSHFFMHTCNESDCCDTIEHGLTAE
jgi:hypothetical protein